MIREFCKAYGDNAPAYARLILSVYGSGQVHVPIGWRPSAATVSFARLFADRSDELLPYGTEEGTDEPIVFVGHYDSYTLSYDDPMTDTGFWVQYRNIPESEGLDINYYCDH